MVVDCDLGHPPRVAEAGLQPCTARAFAVRTRRIREVSSRHAGVLDAKTDSDGAAHWILTRPPVDAASSGGLEIERGSLRLPTR